MSTRRDFLRQVAVISAQAATIPMLDLTTLALPTPTKPTVAIAKGNDYAKLVDQVIEMCGGIGSFVKTGDRVVVKPNIGWDRGPETAANTHPQVVQRIVKLCLDAGAKQVQVFDHTCNDPRRCYQNSGIGPAIAALNDPRASAEFIDRRKWVNVKIKDARAVQEWEFYRDALQCDCYINVPVAKHHGLTRLSLALKNNMGVIGGNRGLIHPNIGEKLADLNTVINPRLNIIDATRILLRHGPQGGNPEDVEVRDTLIASTDIVAADAYASTLFGLKPSDLSTTVAAAKRGLGIMDLDQMDIRQVA